MAHSDHASANAVDLVHNSTGSTPEAPRDHSENFVVDMEKTLTGHGNKDSNNLPKYVEFGDADPRDPLQFSKTRKWTITLVACAFTFITSANASSYTVGFPSMERDLNCTSFQAAIGLGVYCLGFSVIPLVSAPISEELGRRPLYVVTVVCFALMNLACALADNIQTVIIARFLAGAFGSTGSTMVGGTVADIWSSDQRGLPMSLFCLTALGATSLGAVAGGWVEQNSHLQWRWIQWISLIMAGVLSVAVYVCMQETRSSVLLTRMAQKMRKEMGDQSYRSRAEDEKPDLRTLLMVSATRPIYLVLTEPVAASFSLWAGFAWGVLYAILESIHPVFSTLYNFNSGQAGTVFVTILIGSLFGLLSNMYQETLYRSKFAARGPEARLYVVCFTGVLFPMGMFIFAWTAFSHVPWMAPAIGIVVAMWGLFSIYCTGFTYLADVYGPYASSAIAGQSMCRNLMGMAFPLFTQQMLKALGYNWTNTLFALVAVALVPVPMLLFFYGPKIRARSKFSSEVMLKDALPVVVVVKP